MVVPIPGLEVIGRKKESALRFAAAGVDIALPGVSARTSHGEDAMQCSRNVTARQTDSTPLCSRQSKSKSKSKSKGTPEEPLSRMPLDHRWGVPTRAGRGLSHDCEARRAGCSNLR